MTDQEAFIRKIVERPEDNMPRLAFSDWLEDNAGEVECPTCQGFGEFVRTGQGCHACDGTGRVPNGNAERAEFIRLQCELARRPRQVEWLAQMPVEQWAGGGEEGDLLRRLDALRRRERELLKLAPGWLGWTLNDPHYDPCLDEFYDDIVYGPTRSSFRRGFVERVWLPLAAFLGEVCGRCGGAKRPGGCGLCGNSGRVGGCAGVLCRAQPVMRVELTDRVPMEVLPNTWCWGRSYATVIEERHRIPSDVFGRLAPNARGCERIDYPTRAAAVDALSVVLVAHGRKAAGLPTWRPRP